MARFLTWAAGLLMSRKRYRSLAPPGSGDHHRYYAAEDGQADAPPSTNPRFKLDEETKASVIAQLNPDETVHVQIIGNQAAQHVGHRMVEMLEEAGFRVSKPHRVGSGAVAQDRALVIKDNTISLDPEK